VYRKYIDPDLADPPEAPVKIAVLDMGVDDENDMLDTGQIKMKRNWTDGYQRATYDRDGHGTFMAGLLMDYAPDAQLYISKISEGKPCAPHVIAKVFGAFSYP
jgi:hypothetical protein